MNGRTAKVIFTCRCLLPPPHPLSILIRQCRSRRSSFGRPWKVSAPAAAAAAKALAAVSLAVLTFAQCHSHRMLSILLNFMTPSSSMSKFLFLFMQSQSAFFHSLPLLFGCHIWKLRAFLPLPSCPPISHSYPFHIDTAFTGSLFFPNWLAKPFRQWGEGVGGLDSLPQVQCRFTPYFLPEVNSLNIICSFHNHNKEVPGGN